MKKSTPATMDALSLSWSTISFNVNATQVEVETRVLETVDLSLEAAVTLGTLYFDYGLLRPIIRSVFKRLFGGERDDQRGPHYEEGSLRVLLHCLTEKRFLEIFEDYESGKMKDHLQEEFILAGIMVTGLSVEIDNMEEVSKRKKAINKRYYSGNILAVKYMVLILPWLLFDMYKSLHELGLTQNAIYVTM